MQILYLVLGLSILSTFNTYTMKRALCVQSGDISVEKSTYGNDNGCFDLISSGVFAKIMRSCDSKTRTGLMKTNRYLRYYCIPSCYSIPRKKKLHAQGLTPLYLAAQKNKIEIVQFLLMLQEINVNASFQGATPLQAAAEKGYHEIVKLFLAHQDIAVSSDGNTALYIAAQNGHTNVVDLLLADPRIKVNILFLGSFPLYIAAQNGRTPVVRVLLTHPGIEADATAPNGATSLYIAVQNGHTEVVTLLLGQGVRANKKAAGDFPLHIAAHKGYSEIITLLIAHDSNLVNLQSEKNWFTPLHYACKAGHVDAVSALLKAPYININALTTDGKTPLDVARENNHMHVAKLLLYNNGLSGKYIKNPNYI